MIVVPILLGLNSIKYQGWILNCSGLGLTLNMDLGAGFNNGFAISQAFSTLGSMGL